MLRRSGTARRRWARLAVLVAAGGSIFMARSAAATVRPGWHATGPDTVRVTVGDFYIKAPAAIPSGLTTLLVKSESQSDHSVLILRLAAGRTIRQYVAAYGANRDPGWATPLGGAVTAGPGSETNVTLNLNPGSNYAMVSYFVAPDGKTHAQKGEVHVFRVTRSTRAPGPEPKSDITLTMTDYAYQVAPQIAAGPHVIRVENPSGQAHEALIVRLLPGKTMAEAVAWDTAPIGPPPYESFSSVARMAPGLHLWMSANFKPGKYVISCYTPDKKTARPHIKLGMLTQIEVR